MEQTNGPHPPPYNFQDYGRDNHGGTSYQVGKENIAVVSPPGPYDNTVHPGVQTATAVDHAAPPDYSYGLEDSSFSDGVVRRGELTGAKADERSRVCLQSLNKNSLPCLL